MLGSQAPLAGRKQNIETHRANLGELMATEWGLVGLPGHFAKIEYFNSYTGHAFSPLI